MSVFILRRSRINRIVSAILLTVAGLMSLGTVIAYCCDTTDASPPRPNELFDPKLSSVNSLAKAEALIRQSVIYKGAMSDIQIANEIELFARRRFYHSYAYHSFSENWIAWVSGIFWSDLKAEVRADEIFTSQWAGCSQQAIAVQALLSRFGIQFASLRSPDPRHFATVAWIDGEWMLVDSWDQIKRSALGPVSLASIRRGNNPFDGELGNAYAESIRSGRYIVNSINNNPAPRQSVFDYATHIASNWGWIICWALFFIVSWPRWRDHVRTPLYPAKVELQQNAG